MSKDNTLLFFGMTLDTTGFKKGLASAKKTLKKESEQFKKDLSDLASFGTKLALAGAATAVGIGVITKKSLESINAQNILAESIGTTQSKIAGLELATEKWGVETKMVLDKMKEKGGFENFLKLADQVKNAGNAQQQLNMAIKLFGNEGGKILPILQLGSAGLANMEKEAIKLSLALNPEQVKKSVIAWKEFENFMLRVKGIGTQIGVAMAGSFGTIFNGFNAFIETYSVEIKGFFESISIKATETVKYFIEAFTTYGIPFISGFIGFANQIGTAFETIFNYISGGAGSTFGDLTTSMSDFLATFTDSIAYGILSAIELLVDGAFITLQRLFDSIADQFKIAATILHAFGRLSIDAYKTIISGQENISNSIKGMGDKITKPLAEIKDELIESMADTLANKYTNDIKKQAQFKGITFSFSMPKPDEKIDKSKSDKKTVNRTFDALSNFVKDAFTSKEKEKEKGSDLKSFASLVTRGSVEDYKIRNSQSGKLLTENQKQTTELRKLNDYNMKRILV